MRRVAPSLAPPLLALAMGLPTLGGRFVGGDDQRLVLNHVLVSRPSLQHAWQLLTEVRPHRDLYQPLPLISFSAEFALCEAWGLRADLPFPGGGAWVFHLTNVLIHAGTAILVFFLLRRWSGSDGIACATACLFAVHPLNVETVAWVNGRMMLLSTFFLLASLLAMDRQLHKPTLRCGTWAVVFAVLSLISKVRIGLPLLMLLIPLIHRAKPRRAFWLTWAAALALTGVFVIINVGATAEHEMFEHAAQQMEGSRLARCVLALGWYVQHFLWPSGLAAWYEAPGVARWTDGATLRAALVVLAVAVALTVSLRWTKLGWWAAAFFMLGIGDTLPIIPARNLLAADRYMYLPIVAAAWATTELLAWIVRRRTAEREVAGPRGDPSGSGKSSSSPSNGAAPCRDGTPCRDGREARPVSMLAGAAWVAIVVALLLVSWKSAAYYGDMIVKTRRIAEVHPNSPWVHERLGWAYFNAERYAEAIEAGEIELQRHAETSGCEALILIGVSEAASGDVDRGIETLRRAVALKPDDPMAQYRLASVLADAGQSAEAMALFRKALPELPLFNPGLTRAAALFQREGLLGEARDLYQKILVNNPFDPNAAFELAKMDLDAGDTGGAVARLQAILEGAPEFTPARVNLGVGYERLGRFEEAVEAYETALRYDPAAVAAMLNLARLHEASGRMAEAERLLRRAVDASARSTDCAAGLHDFFLRNGRPMDAAQFWTALAAERPLSIGEQVRHAFALALGGDMDSATDLIDALPESVDRAALDAGLEAVDAWLDAQPAAAIPPLEAIAASRAPEAGIARDAMLASFIASLQRNPENPWLYYFCGVLQEAAGQHPVAIAALEVFIELCPEEAWREHAQQRLTRIKPAVAPPPDPDAKR
ncbi:MAG: tetratricopeptide repeat protein [Phycisphaerales bacterium]|nr:tetratricopeptide repeat protein [Phycisphaerales bacterium]